MGNHCYHCSINELVRVKIKNKLLCSYLSFFRGMTIKAEKTLL